MTPLPEATGTPLTLKQLRLDPETLRIAVLVRRDQVERYAYLVTIPGRTPEHQARLEGWLAECREELAALEQHALALAPAGEGEGGAG
ncbi:hypothetical protein Q0M94_28500 (plasmid) [Deinococcus radiomollis]|uniref:hypothetical protein n=1 Tax=Deinococcus radiomollis TaxID=468916 RepID=UPI0038929159